MIILQYCLFTISFFLLLFILILLKGEMKQKKSELIEDSFFLIYLLIMRLHEEIDELKGFISDPYYVELKKAVDRIKIDLFDD